MLLPRIDPPITPGQVSLGPYETLSTASITNQVMRALRQTRGFDAYELAISGTDAKVALLSEFGRLSKDDAADELALSRSLDSLVLTAIDAIDDATSSYAAEDQRILKIVAARSFGHVLADAMKRFVEGAAIQLAEERKNAA